MCMCMCMYAGISGRNRLAEHTMIEIIRADARPYFMEGQTPPECVGRWNASDTSYRLGATPPPCWTAMANWGGGQFPPGCWARPAVGTGVWINASRVQFYDRLNHHKGDPPLPNNPRRLTAVHDILDAAARGFELVHYSFGDETVAAGEDVMVTQAFRKSSFSPIGGPP